MQTKYTTDGKKVAIVGKLNNTETIVQEIFVSENGSEIPAGENFVVKSLLDAPAKSWKESQIEQSICSINFNFGPSYFDLGFIEHLANMIFVR